MKEKDVKELRPLRWEILRGLLETDPLLLNPNIQRGLIKGLLEEDPYLRTVLKLYLAG